MNQNVLLKNFLRFFISFHILFSGKVFSQNCENWLSLPSQGAKITVGDADVSGDKLTIEAMFNRTAALNNGVYYGHLVSKHTDQTNVNYALLPNGCEITTSVSGYKAIFQTCVPELNKTYHVAMVYDGATLKFYRNGFLMSQVACTGNMINNNLATTIGQLAGNGDPAINQFLGYVNEVRIWKVARSQSQIQAYMDKTLPNPASQTGLVASYSFDNTSNKQGNTAFNGMIAGGAITGATNAACSLTPSACNTVTNVQAGFIIPDTVCVNTPVNISNISLNATSSYWNFNVADIKSVPDAENLGNPSGNLRAPVFMDYVEYNGNWYGFVINHEPGGLVRLDFGNSLLNTPTSTNLGNFGGAIPPGPGAEGIQMVFNEGKWYAIIVGGYTLIGSQPRIIKIDFGANLLNPAPIVTNWGNVGNLLFPVDLHVFKEGNNWYGFTVNAENNTIVRFNFTNSFENTPTAVNLGNIGGFDFPTGIYAINDNNDWKVFVLNRSETNNFSITRLDFGNSLLNTPTAVNLGNPGGLLKQPRDFTIMKFCGEIIGFVVNEQTSDIVRLDFGNDLSSIPFATSLGNIGQLNFPHSISKFFRVGADVYSFITNVQNNTITRLKFTGSNGSSIPNSTLENPPPVTYTIPGIYNINLTIDDGLPTQASLCKQVVVLPELVHNPTQDISICEGSSIKLGSSSETGTYQWNNGITTDSIVVNTSGIYWVETSRYGCVNRDSFNVTVSPPLTVDLGADKTICPATDIILDAGNAGSSYLWNDGSTEQSLTVTEPGTYYVRVTKGGCVSSDTIQVTTFSISSFDFSYKQDVCDPLSVQFNGIGTSLTNSYWHFGDGSSLTGSINPVHQFPATGNFLVKYSISNGICSDTIEKAISINILWGDIVLTPDTTICYGSIKQLRTASSLNFCWSPASFLDNPDLANPVTSTRQDITYYFTAEVTGANLITNGNFSQGNSGFTSAYNFANLNITEGEYFVGPDPKSWNSSLSSCKDHTTGNGNMMLVNGSPTADMNVWKQTVNVTPNTNYAFSTWIQALWPPNPAQLQFSINGKDAGSLITASLPTCSWTQFYTTWNSGNNTTAVISIVNKNTLVQGNDFALDDISFAPAFIKRDSVKIKVEKPSVQANIDTTICSGKSAQLNATGAQNYSWSPVAGLSSAGIADPVASPVVSTEYIVTGTTASGCSANDTVLVNIYPKTSINISPDTTICKNTQARLSVTGGSSYNWSPSATLNDPLIANPVASPVIGTMYYVNITDENACEWLDSVKVNVRPDAAFSINAPARICFFDSTQLSASGGNIYAWEPAEGLSNTSIANPWVSPSVNTEYKVTITETTCNQSATLSTRLTVMPVPKINAMKANDIDCSNDRSQLNATGAVQYTWTPAITLTNPSIANPVARPETTTVYVVKGTDMEGCTGYDTITVKVDNVNKSGYLMPNAFTPNYDGLNDCYGVKYWGVIEKFEFSIYNRWGERIFNTKDPGQCWDGTYKGVEQDAGVYVYMINAETTCEAEVFRKGTFTLIR